MTLHYFGVWWKHRIVGLDLFNMSGQKPDPESTTRLPWFSSFFNQFEKNLSYIPPESPPPTSQNSHLHPFWSLCQMRGNCLCQQPEKKTRRGKVAHRARQGAFRKNWRMLWRRWISVGGWIRGGLNDQIFHIFQSIFRAVVKLLPGEKGFT